MRKILNILRKITPKSVMLFYHKLLAKLSDIIYGHPSGKMKVIGITGTDGKTTTVYFTSSILEQAGYKVAVANSIQFKIGQTTWPNQTDTTMPGRFKLQKFLSKAKKEKVDYVVLEVTSQGVAQSRHLYIDFDVACITNLTPEHLDTHKTMENYKQAKGKLFAALSNSKKKDVEKNIIVNGDDPNYDYFLQFPAHKKFVYTLHPIAYTGGEIKTAVGTKINLQEYRSSFILVTGEEEIEIDLEIPGKFNIYNALAAASIALSQNIDLQTIKKGLEKVDYIPGRMEEISQGQDFKVIVDFAHTPAGMENLFNTVKVMTSGKLIAVFGATGGRDPGKRPKIGEVAGRLADFSVLTAEDPRWEDPVDIAHQIEKGLQKVECKKDINYCIIPDRRKAIRYAFSKAQKDDIVVLASMGCYQYMYVGQGKIPWDDRKVAREELRKLNN
jgi:UDP-N-acetylmuramoyl-L-alanyl-D-glutamate--2,6-diaminopimelate ligase